MAKFRFDHPTVFLTADVEWKAKLSLPSSTASYAHRSPTNLHVECGMVWYRTSSYAHRSPQTYMACVVSVSAQHGIVALGKAHTRSTPSFSSLPKAALETVPIFCLVEHRSLSTLEGGMSAASFLHSSFLQAVNAVMLWLVRVEKSLKPLSTSALPSCRPDVISAVVASLSARSLPRTVNPQKSL